MDANWVGPILHKVQDLLWVDTVNQILGKDEFAPWVSSFHPDKLPCQLEGNSFYNGGFNAGLKMVFDDGTAWMVRFPRKGIISDDYADEKVAMEVTALNIIREKTTIPVPKVHAWGLAASNSLGLGPFMIMEFIEGVHLNELLIDDNAEKRCRLLREDYSDHDIEFLYRQLANYILQIFQLDFDQIGSLPWPGAEARDPKLIRPLTFKAHSILQDGGVNTLGDRSQGFKTTTEYFQYLMEQNWEQLIKQPNSVFGVHYSSNAYMSMKTLKSLASDLINPEYDSSKFKLICDDLGLANLIVRSKDDLTVVGVVDFEWSYIGPAQLFATPWWLLQERPTFWDYVDDEPPNGAVRFPKYLEIFMRVLEEEEEKNPEYKDKELSRLIQWSRVSGAIWLHMLLMGGFNDHSVFPTVQLRQHLGAKWEEREKELRNTEEIKAFSKQKNRELDEYDMAVDKMNEDMALVDLGEMTKEDFLAKSAKTTAEFLASIARCRAEKECTNGNQDQQTTNGEAEEDKESSKSRA